jgi:hypothetical protein
MICKKFIFMCIYKLEKTKTIYIIYKLETSRNLLSSSLMTEEDSSNQMQAGRRKYDNKMFVKKVVQLVSYQEIVKDCDEEVKTTRSNEEQNKEVVY